MKYLYWAIVVVALVIGISLIVDRCNQPTNTKVTDITIPVIQDTEPIFVGDSIKALQQNMLLTNDRMVIAALQDSLQRMINRSANVRPEVLIKYRENFVDTYQIGKLKDSLSTVIDDLLAKSHEVTFTQEEFKAYKAQIMASKIPYKIETKYRYEVGKIDYHGNIQSDSLNIVSDPLISVGQKTGFLKRPSYAITVGNANPLISQSNLSSVIYTPERKVQISAGPIVLFDPKNVSAGLGVTVKKGILSVTVGYQLVNTNNK